MAERPCGVGALTVERRALEDDALFIGGREDHAVDVGLVVHACSVDEDLHASRHRSLVDEGIPCLVAVTYTPQQAD